MANGNTAHPVFDPSGVQNLTLIFRVKQTSSAWEKWNLFRQSSFYYASRSIHVASERSLDVFFDDDGREGFLLKIN